MLSRSLSGHHGHGHRRTRDAQTQAPARILALRRLAAVVGPVGVMIHTVTLGPVMVVVVRSSPVKPVVSLMPRGRGSRL
jgi:hypothetical protein